MAQTVTLRVGASVTGGPTLASESKIEVASYTPYEETICRCQTGSIELELPAREKVGMILIASDKYTNDKDCVLPNGKTNCKCVRFKFDECDLGAPIIVTPAPIETAMCKAKTDATGTWYELTSAQIISGCCVSAVVPECATRLCIDNPLATDIKVSVLVTRKPACQCAAPAATPTAA
jgi:hypothetical protein